MTQVFIPEPLTLQVVEQDSDSQDFSFLWGSQSEPQGGTACDFDITAVSAETMH